MQKKSRLPRCVWGCVCCLCVFYIIQEWDCPVSTNTPPQHLPDINKRPQDADLILFLFSVSLFLAFFSFLQARTHTLTYTHATLRHPPSGFNLGSSSCIVLLFPHWLKNIEETNYSYYGAGKLPPEKYCKVYVYIYCRRRWDLERICVRK